VLPKRQSNTIVEQIIMMMVIVFESLSSSIVVLIVVLIGVAVDEAVADVDVCLELDDCDVVSVSVFEMFDGVVVDAAVVVFVFGAVVVFVAFVVVVVVVVALVVVVVVGGVGGIGVGALVCICIVAGESGSPNVRPQYRSTA
jgi:hypothetical protein